MYCKPEQFHAPSESDLFNNFRPKYFTMRLRPYAQSLAGLSCDVWED